MKKKAGLTPSKKNAAKSTVGSLAGLGLPAYLPDDGPAMVVVGKKLVIANVVLTTAHIKAIQDHPSWTPVMKRIRRDAVEFDCGSRPKAQQLLQDFFQAELLDDDGEPLMNDDVFENISTPVDA